MSNQIMPDELAEKPQPQPGDFPDDNAAKTKTWPLYSPDGASSVIVDENSATFYTDAGWVKTKPKPAAP